MISVEFQRGDKLITAALPESWSDLSRRQYALVARANTRKVRSQVHAQFLHAFGVPRHVTEELSPGVLATICRDSAVTNTLPEHHNWMGTRIPFFTPPKNALSNISTDQFGLADQWMRKFLDSKTRQDSRKNLNRLFACLYHMRGVKWSRKTADIYTILATLLPRKMKIAIAYSFLGCSRWYAKQFPKTHKKKTSKGPDYGWPGLIVDLAGPKFGHPDQVKKTSIYEVMVHLEQGALKADQMERDARRARLKRR